STANALEALAYQAKDAILVVDDLAPAGGQGDVQRLHRDADRLLRAQGNVAGRQRMRADGTLRRGKPPRGLLLRTAAETPRGQSLRARLLTLELDKSDVDWVRMTACQEHAAQGRYAEALSGFIQWLASSYDNMLAFVRGQVADLQAASVGTGTHRRR